MSRWISARLIPAVLIAAALGACQSAGPPPSSQMMRPASSAPSGVTPGTFAMPGGAGCAGEVARFQAVMDNDLATGHTTQAVHGRVSGEIASARAACAAGNEGGAVGQINATKARFGYR